MDGIDGCWLFASHDRPWGVYSWLWILHGCPTISRSVNVCQLGSQVKQTTVFVVGSRSTMGVFMVDLSWPWFKNQWKSRTFFLTVRWLGWPPGVPRSTVELQDPTPHFGILSKTPPIPLKPSRCIYHHILHHHPLSIHLSMGHSASTWGFKHKRSKSWKR